MPDNAQNPKRSITPDWIVQGALTRIGDMFDRLTGRSWKPASSLATSGLIERLKTLLDSHIKQDADGRRYVPHNIKLKMQWDKFSTDSDKSLKKVENELLTAAVDHISDNRYYTYAPLKLEAKADYFTEGVKLFVGYDQFDEEAGERELNVTIPATNLSHLIPGSAAALDAEAKDRRVASGELVVKYDIGRGQAEMRFNLEQGKRLSVGRTKDNDLALDHTSVSKMHASLLLNSEGKLVVADTGSTNGTFLNGERITYGKAIEIFAGDKIKFGGIDVRTEFTPTPEPETSSDSATEAYTVGDFQFSKKTEVVAPAVKSEVPRTNADTEIDTEAESEK
ncbi:MAG: FHA domain-containing protein [Pyrinomonadaceae bacterium]